MTQWSKKDRRDFADALTNAFEPFRETITLSRNLMAQQEGAQSIILMVCARLDSLSNLAIYGEGTGRDKFTRFVENYSGESRFFKRVSVGNLYSILSWKHWIAEGGVVSKAGRVLRVEQQDDRFLKFLEDSGIAITTQSVYSVLGRVVNCLEKSFRVRPRQRRSKILMATVEDVRESVASRYKSGEMKQVADALSSFARFYRASQLLYERYRNEVIHGLPVAIDEARFFKEAKPYHRIRYRHDVKDSLVLEFPGMYLIDLLEQCLSQYEAHSHSTMEVPFQLYLEMFPDDLRGDLKWLETVKPESVGEYGDVKWRLRG